ncbi:hypothetical protein [Thalassospira povalilytica]|uniref:hypothetical protein n=1 Tax=Thalassospira TaxID=168934 RepID=UPI001D17D5A9|nr:hypothetical protein [Thalassospira povalilytica]MCC4239319.1 hypothetical protein [Thalassospira povalilytica]MEE3047288.1 hypothetical protein [Pseudomonadota bacterium]
MGLLKETLMRVFVGKKGRDAIRAYNNAQSLQVRDPATAEQAAAQARQARRIEDRALAHQDEGMSLEEARALALAETLTEQADTPHTEIMKALNAADAKLGKQKSKIPTEADERRQELINEAVKALRSKQGDLDRLDPDLRAKLTVMAVGALMGGPNTRQ